MLKPMITSSVMHISKYLNDFLRRSFDLTEDIAVPSVIMEQDGSVSTNINNKIVISLVNIEKDTTPGQISRNEPSGSNRGILSYPPIHLNLYLMFSAHFNSTNYIEALKFLSYTISYFQRNPIFNHQNSPDLDNRISMLALEIENLNIKDLSSLWSVISSKYLPSVLYKVRMITFDAKDVREQIPILKEPQSSVTN